MMSRRLETAVVAFLASVHTVLGRRAMKGHQIGNMSSGFDFILPVSISQCEPILIYYNTTNKNAFHTDTGNLVWLFFYTPWDGDFFFEIPVSYGGIGYIDWICNVPAGNDFIIKLSSGGGPGQYYTVQPGSPSCLGDVTTTYPSAFYESTFQSYTHNPYPLASYYAANTQYHLPTITFPTSSYPTITVNPNLAVQSKTSTPSVVISSSAIPSPPMSSPAVSSSAVSPPSASSYKRHRAAIAGGVVGGAAVALLILALAVLLRRRRKSRFEQARATPVMQLLGSVENVLHGNQSMSDTGPQSTPHPSDTSGRSSSSSLGENMNTTSDLDPTQDSTRLPTGKRQVDLPSSNSSPDLVSETPPPPHSRMSTQSQLSTSETQGSLTTVLDVISRAQLNLRERHTLVANLLIADQLGPTENRPPSYSSVESSARIYGEAL